MVNMITDAIKKTEQTLEERGLQPDSYYHIVFSDGSEITEKESNWSDFSTLKRVSYKGMKKSVMSSNHPIKTIPIFHGELSTKVDVSEGQEVYQAIRSETLFMPNGSKQSRIIGRVVGIIRDGEVIEERFINGMHNSILGFRK